MYRIIAAMFLLLASAAASSAQGLFSGTLDALFMGQPELIRRSPRLGLGFTTATRGATPRSVFHASH
jgi:hypothetical protein